MYGGFWIEKPVGNNKFSYEARLNKKIYVPEIIVSDLDGVKLAQHPSFIELEEGEEKICRGLDKIYKLECKEVGDKEVYLFDNHNHSFYFWAKGLKEGKVDRGIDLVHIDQHKDTREPDNYEVDFEDLVDVARYTTEVLNVGSFIKPAMERGIFKDLYIIDSTYSMSAKRPDGYILDLDLDFFSEDMDYIGFDERLECVIGYVKNTDFITIATSPYFIDQKRAIEVLKMIFSR
ncbi:MAG: UPF0489 family protein [Peptostreptococcus anaerobius]